MRTIDRLHGILVFLRVVETGSLSAAARALGVSTAAVSAALARLEVKLEVRLLNRTTRRLHLTAEGADFHARCKQIAADLEEAEAAVGRAARTATGRLRVSMPAALGRNWIIPELSRFAAEHPSVSLEVLCMDHVPYMVEEGLDVSVIVGELPSTRLAVRRLASTRYAVCASPAYLAGRGIPRQPQDLAGHACLAYRRPRNGRLREWRFGNGEARRNMPVSGYMTFNGGDALVAAARAGLGVIQVAEYYVRAALDDGSLTEVLAEHKADAYDIWAVFPQRRPVAPKVRAFVDFLAGVFGRPPWTRPVAARRASGR